METHTVVEYLKHTSPVQLFYKDKTMSNDTYKTWDEQRGKIRTGIGGWKIGEGVTTHGYSLFDELVGKVSWFEILILNIAGKRPEQRLTKWIEAVYSCLSFPDSRIWCNQIGASDSRMYGPGTLPTSYDFLLHAMQQYQDGVDVKGIVEGQSRRSGSQPIIPGYGRPLATGDERVLVMNDVTENLGFEWGAYMHLAREIDQYMLKEYNESMNFATFIVAFLQDQEWSRKEICRVTWGLVTAGVAACYSEAYDKPAETFLPLRCDDIDYQGVASRPVPD